MAEYTEVYHGSENAGYLTISKSDCYTINLTKKCPDIWFAYCLPFYRCHFGTLSEILSRIHHPIAKAWLEGWADLRQRNIYHTLYDNTTLIPDLIHIITSYDL